VNKKFAVPRGTSDILPDIAPLWETLESKAREICKSYGYHEIRTPVYEDVNLFRRSLGQTSDVVNKQLLELVSNKHDEGYALRPEGTASIVRAYLENSFDKNEPLSKFFYIGPMFRGERPQKGRLRQFHQIGVEAIGVDGASPFLDAEVIALAMHLLGQFAVKGLHLKINSLGSQEDKANISAWLREEFTKHRTDLCEDCQSRYERNVFRVLDCKKEPCRKASALVVKNLPLSEESKNYFDKVQSALESIGIAFEVSPHLVRGLDYYTHTVFEITAEGLGSQDAVGAGGRYGGLAFELGGTQNIAGIGFALGLERILLASAQASAVKSGLDAFVIAMKEEYQPLTFSLLQQLREAGLRADASFSGGSMKSQMGRANKANARFALIIGEQEFKDKTVSLKDMAAGEQETVPLSEFVDILKNKLK
jgi:histidyl-tRNA synthetase